MDEEKCFLGSFFDIRRIFLWFLLTKTQQLIIVGFSNCNGKLILCLR